MKRHIIGEQHGYIHYPLGEQMEGAIEYIQKALKVFLNLYDEYSDINLFCRGSSGAIMAALFAAYHPHPGCVYIHHIKKEGESSHSSQCPSYLPEYINVIIDDFIGTGRTLNAIYKALEDSTIDGVAPVIDCLIVGRDLKTYNLKFKVLNAISQS